MEMRYANLIALKGTTSPQSRMLDLLNTVVMLLLSSDTTGILRIYSRNFCTERVHEQQPIAVHAFHKRHVCGIFGAGCCCLRRDGSHDRRAPALLRNFLTPAPPTLPHPRTPGPRSPGTVSFRSLLRSAIRLIQLEPGLFIRALPHTYNSQLVTLRPFFELMLQL